MKTNRTEKKERRNEERVLARRLGSELNEKELKAVSGGGCKFTGDGGPDIKCTF